MALTSHGILPLNNSIMKKYALFISLLVYGFLVFSQDRYKLANSTISFFSEALLENIDAHNKKAIGVVDFKKMNFAFRIPIKEFIFKNSLMQEHFNENYLESDKFPTASYKGAISGTINLKKDGTYNVKVKGTLDIHGEVKERELDAKVEVKGKSVSLYSTFDVALKDHDIDIPTIMFNKIAEQVKVTVEGSLVGM